MKEFVINIHKAFCVIAQNKYGALKQVVKELYNLINYITDLNIHKVFRIHTQEI